MTEKNQKKDLILSKRVWVVDKYNFYEYISIMLEWWVGITESLESVNSKITSPYFKQKIEELITYISSGDSFSKSMRKIPDIFPNAEVSVIEAWETTGKLANSLLKLSNDLKKIQDLKNKIKWALTYPIIIFIVLVIAITVVMTYVIPSIKPLFEWTSTELPLMTKLLIWTSDFVSGNLALLLLIVISIVWFLIVYINTGKWKLKFEKFIVGFPLLWKVYRNYILANIASTLWNLVGSWVAIIKSLKLTWAASKSALYEWLLEKVAERVGNGEGIINSMKAIDDEWEFFPADYLQMLSVWEKTASLEEVSLKLSRQYEKEVDYSLANMTKWIEPIAIFFAWIFVTWFALAIFWAIMQVTQTVW